MINAQEEVMEVGESERRGGMGQPIVLREYQKELAGLGVKQNIIVCLPTGSGKTIIAVAVMNSPEFQHEVLSEGKKIVFVVTTVHLGQQQADYIKKHTSYKVLLCTSDTTKSKSWTQTKWKQEIESHQVLVMIAQLCFDSILHNAFNFNKMSLLVLDECHNATKLHKMNEIMSLYHNYVEANVGAHSPRIVGLTATINKKKIQGEVTEGRVAIDVKALEEKLAAKAVSFEDIDEVKRYSTASTIRMAEYSPNSKPGWEGLFDGIKALHGFIETQGSRKKAMSDIERLALAMRLPNFSISSTYSSNNKSDEVKKELNRLILDFEEMYNNIGPLGCAEVVEYKLEWLLQLLNKVDGHNQIEPYDILNIKALMTQLYSFHCKVNQKLGNTDGKNNMANIKNFLSHKMDTLLNILKEYSDKEGHDDQLLGLVFVERRSYATAIKAVLELIADADPKSFGFIKPELITGTNNKKKDAKELRVSMANQKKIIDSFHGKHINLIICTTVLEEGIDIPTCNLVVRFDEIYAYTSFIQSMGRARKSGAKFFVLISSTEKVKEEKKLEKFMKQRQFTDNVLKKPKDRNRSLLPYESLDDGPRLEIDDLAPFGSGAKVVASSAIALVYRYVQKDSKRKILSWWNFEIPRANKPEHKFSASVWIQGSSLPGIIKGPLMTSTQDAKKAVFMEVCRELYESGALDENLLPV